MSEPAMGAPSDSPPTTTAVTQAEVSGTPPSQPDASAASSPADGVPPELDVNAQFDALEAGRGTADSPPVSSEDSQGADDAASPTVDEPGDAAPKAQDASTDLSQDHYNKSFTERPEWQAALKLVPKEQQGALRAALRPMLERENAMHRQLEQAKPHSAMVERMRRAVGEEGVENSIRLIESWNAGHPQAREILTQLLRDFDQRTGAVVSSDDLKQRQAAIDARVADGVLDEAEANRLKQDLLEVEKARIAVRTTETQQRQVAAQMTQAQQQRLVQERTSAMNSWEASVMKSDPDYPKLQDLVIAVARQAADEQQATSKTLLTAADMVNILKHAYAKVKGVGMVAKPRARQAITGNGSSANTRPQPRDAREEYFAKLDELEGR